MVKVEGGNLVSEGEVPGGFFKGVPPDSIYQTDDDTPEGMPVCLALNPWCWDPLCATRGDIEG